MGITHPRTPGFVNELDYEGNIHEAEFQLFHCTAKGNSFADVFYPKSFTDEKKLLYPSERPGEKQEIWAPHLMKYDKKFHIIYSQQEMRRVSSEDFVHWNREPSLFVCTSPAARDPYIYEENGRFLMIYTEERQLKYRISENLEDWSEEKILQKQLFAGCENESPFFMKRNGIYYLFWSIYDGKNGCYDNRTMVFASETLEGFWDAAPITMLRAHAPEVVQDRNGDCYLLSVFYPRNGISAVKLRWT